MGSHIIYFRDYSGRPGVFRFVKAYSPKRFLRRERIEYTLDITRAMDFSAGGMELVRQAHRRIMKDWSCEGRTTLGVSHTDSDDFMSSYRQHRFWVITRRGEDGEPVEFYSGRDRKGRDGFSDDIGEASIGLDLQSETDTVKRLRVGGGHVSIDCVYLTLVNGLLEDNFMIICKSRKEDGRTRFFARQEDNRLRLVETSGAAKKMAYREAYEVYEHLESTNRNFSYAVLPAFVENVHCRDLEGYVKRHGVQRAVKMNLRLSETVVKREEP